MTDANQRPAVVGQVEPSVRPQAWRYWKDKFGCWEYSDTELKFPAVPAGTKLHPLYDRNAVAQLEATAAALAIERADLRAAIAVVLGTEAGKQAIARMREGAEAASQDDAALMHAAGLLGA
jgi:hypothetical protein